MLLQYVQMPGNKPKESAVNIEIIQGQMGRTLAKILEMNI